MIHSFTFPRRAVVGLLLLVPVSCGETDTTNGDLPPSRADAFEDEPAVITHPGPGYSPHICTIQLGDFSYDMRCFDALDQEWCCYPAVCGAAFGECGAGGAGGLGGGSSR